MRNFKQLGNVLPVTAPYDVTQGDGVLVGHLFGLATATRKAGQPLDIVLQGEFFVNKNLAEAWAVGDKIYWNNTTKKFTEDFSGGVVVGLASEVAANPSAIGSLLLSPQPGMLDAGFNQVTGKVAKTIAVVTQAQYDALATKDAETLYVIVG